MDQDQVRHVLNEEYKHIEIEKLKIRNTTHVKREIRVRLFTHPASTTLPPLLSPSLAAALPGARLVLKAMVKITVTFTIITINIFITVLNEINVCLSLSPFELSSLP